MTLRLTTAPPPDLSAPLSAPLRAALPGALALALAAALTGPAQAAPWVLQVRDAAGAPLADTVVAVEVRGQPARASAGTSAQMGQRDKEFVPPLLVVQTGTAVHFPNFDTVRHHVYSFSATKRFELKLYVGTPVEPVLFDKPGVAQLGCNIHDKMAATIVVVDTALFGRTDAQGQLRLDLPAGQHRARLWNASLGNAAPLSVALSVPAAQPGPPGNLKLEWRP